VILARLKHGLLSLAAIRLLGATAFYSLVPFLALWMARATALSVVQLGAIVGVGVFSTRAGALLLPRAVRLLGAREAIATCYGIAVVAIALLTTYRQAEALWLGMLTALLGLSFSGATLATKSLAAATISDEARLRSFSWLNIATNVGAAVGPVIGAALAEQTPTRLPMVAGSLLLICSLLTLVARSDASSATNNSDIQSRTAGRKTDFVRFLILSSVTWFGYSQVFNVLPVAARGTEMAALIPSIFAINGALIIFMQLRITTFLFRLCGNDLVRQNKALAAGNALLALGLSCFWRSTDHAWLWIPAIIAFTFGEAIWSPLYDEMSVRLRTKLSIPTALGFSGFLWGLAESAGAALGTCLALNQTAALSPFAVAALTSVMASLLFLSWSGGRRAP
jgi:DHA1 family multidrug resistance protein-like MFS transporter